MPIRAPPSRARTTSNAADPALEAVDLVDVARRATILVQATHPMLRVHLASGAESYVPTNVDPLWVRRAIAALTDLLIGRDLDTEVTLDVLDDGDTVGIRRSRLGSRSNTPADFTESWTSHGDSTTSPRGLSLALAETVALAHDGRVDLAETPTGMSATLLLSRVSQQPVQHPATATRHPSPDRATTIHQPPAGLHRRVMARFRDIVRVVLRGDLGYAGLIAAWSRQVVGAKMNRPQVYRKVAPVTTTTLEVSVA